MTKHRHPASHKGIPDGSISAAIDTLRSELAAAHALNAQLVVRVRRLEGALRDVAAPALRVASVLEET
jgi:hypothetical protein